MIVNLCFVLKVFTKKRTAALRMPIFFFIIISFEKQVLVKANLSAKQ